MEISKSLMLPSLAAATLFRGGRPADGGAGREVAQPVEPVPEAGPDTRHRAAALASLAERLESADRESPPMAYEGLSNRARMAISAYQAQQDAHRDLAKAAVSQMLGVDYYA